MHKGLRIGTLSAFLLIAVVGSLVFPQLARADGSAPPPPPDSSSSGSTGTTDPSSTTGSGDTASVPPGVNVNVLDSSGNLVPQASQAAADAMAAGDPIWCPAGASPSAGAGGCSANYSNLASLVAGLSGGSQPNQNGTIWITSGTDSSAGIVAINGLVQTTWANNALTVQGGWDGTTSGHIIGTTTFNGANLSISDWKNTVSLNDLVFNGHSVFVSSTGDIHFNDGEVKNSSGTGVVLQTLLGGVGGIYVTNSNLHNNTTDGLDAQAIGNVSLSSVIASSNGANGASLSSFAGTIVASNSTFNTNGSDGFNATAPGTISLSHVTANGNDTAALNFAGTYVSSTNGNVSIDHSEFSNNKFDGLQANALGSIHLSNVTANANDQAGFTTAGTFLTSGLAGNISIDSSNFSSNYRDALQAVAGGSIDLSGVTANSNQITSHTQAGTNLSAGTTGNISIDTSSFSSNGWDGLHATAGGAIDLNGVNADANQASGHTQAGASLASGPTADITIGSSSFSNNHWDGLRAVAGRDIGLSGVTANGNDITGHTQAGTWLASGITGNISIDTSSFSSNHWDGLQAVAGGNIGLTGVTANGNDTAGHSLAGTSLISGPTGKLTIDQSTFNSNGWDGLHGIAGGLINMSYVTANGNGSSGFDQAGTYLVSGASSPITIGASSFNLNHYDGLQAVAGGAITLMGVNANGNDFSGVDIAGTSLVAGGDIVIDPSSFSYNYRDGLHAISNGSVRLSDVTAKGNGFSGSSQAGTYLVAGATGNVTIDNSVFSQNFHDGLHAIGGGNINLNAVTGDHNSSLGSTQAGTYLSAGGDINITGPSSFSSNSWDGLHAISNGAMTVDSVTANYNGGSGFNQAGTYLVANGDVAISGGYFSHNHYDGLHASSTNSITLRQIQADWNDGSGFTHAGTYLVAGGDISIDPSSFSHNAHDGLMAIAGGSIALDRVIAQFNGGDGVNLTAGTNVTSTCSDYPDNGGYGMNANLPGQLGTDNQFFGGNVSGDIHLTGGGTLTTATGHGCGAELEKSQKPVESPSAPSSPSSQATPAAAAAPQQNVVNVSDGQTVSLSCTASLGTTLVLSNRDQVVLLCPITGDASVKHVTVDVLPGKLDTTVTFVSAMDLEVTQNGQTAQTLNGPVKVDFTIPSDKQGANLAILRWNGTQWIDMGGAKTSDGFYESISNQTGVFVLVTR
jgi:hypothetical protein